MGGFVLINKLKAHKNVNKARITYSIDYNLVGEASSGLIPIHFNLWKEERILTAGSVVLWQGYHLKPITEKLKV